MDQHSRYSGSLSCRPSDGVCFSDPRGFLHDRSNLRPRRRDAPTGSLCGICLAALRRRPGFPSCRAAPAWRSPVNLNSPTAAPRQADAACDHGQRIESPYGVRTAQRQPRHMASPPPFRRQAACITAPPTGAVQPRRESDPPHARLRPRRAADRAPLRGGGGLAGEVDAAPAEGSRKAANPGAPVRATGAYIQATPRPGIPRPVARCQARPQRTATRRLPRNAHRGIPRT